MCNLRCLRHVCSNADTLKRLQETEKALREAQQVCGDDMAAFQLWRSRVSRWRDSSGGGCGGDGDSGSSVGCRTAEPWQQQHVCGRPQCAYSDACLPSASHPTPLGPDPHPAPRLPILTWTFPLRRRRRAMRRSRSSGE